MGIRASPQNGIGITKYFTNSIVPMRYNATSE